ncbi:hypothetical protein [Streptacidiphilus neutrinimicus]|uniref:hypothetical protein n=1 Tax=Streptacidiphilus neutrinimicus TaxID=105420 RepID=UPI00157AA9F0|nr:hypothetical protein [Streptacidiphilus neutrinimicus]
MEADGPTARRFPLIARNRPACLPLPDRVQALTELAGRAEQQGEQGLASTVFNQSALLASDLGLPDLSRAMCHLHASAYLNGTPLTAASAIRGLEPLVNLARLQIRAGNADEGRQRLLDLYEAVNSGGNATFEGITVPADLCRTEADRQEVQAWLWRVLLADGTRTLTSTGRWQEALAHIEQHRGIGSRMLDGRQVAVVAALVDNDTQRAADLLTATTPGDPWEQEVTACLAALCHNGAAQDSDTSSALVAYYLRHAAKPGLTVFDIRLGLTTLNTIGSADHASARSLVDDLAQRASTARDGYAARETLADSHFATLATKSQLRACQELVNACGLDSGELPVELATALSSGLQSSESVILHSLAATVRSGA